MSPQLLVADIDRSIEFYAKILGFEVDFRYEDFYAGIIKDGYSMEASSRFKADDAFFDLIPVFFASKN
jgi:catechol 2,3-dioxygenase-like lactoylglutathione lyase family enzyme